MTDSLHAAWSGPNSVQTDEGSGTLTATTRELRTRSTTPAAPRIDSLFGRDSPPPDQFVVVWDAGRSWPMFSLGDLATSPLSRLHRVLLRQEQAREPLAEFLLTTLPTGDGRQWGVVEVLTAAGDPLGTRIALTLLEQADRAVVLAGGPGDKDLVRRIGDFVRSEQWSGPSLLVVSPADKPSRADRLRRGTWPRGLRFHVLEMFPTAGPEWTQQLLAMVLGEGSPEAASGSSPPSSNPAARAASDTEGGDGATEQPLLELPSATANGSEAGLARALNLAARAPGVVACALAALEDGRLLAHAGPESVASAAASSGARMWQCRSRPGFDDPAPLTELVWGTAAHHHVVLPLPGRAGQPAQLLLAVADRGFADIATVRWHLAVARNHLI